MLLMYHCSAQIWRWTNSFLTVLSTIVVVINFTTVYSAFDIYSVLVDRVVHVVYLELQ